jgi:hypothetical protein
MLQLALPAGVLVDRSDRRPIQVVARVLGAIVPGTLAVWAEIPEARLLTAEADNHGVLDGVHGSRGAFDAGIRVLDRRPRSPSAATDPSQAVVAAGVVTAPPPAPRP